jgi:alpha-beta hydrolase superfamily lysophospholipase
MTRFVLVDRDGVEVACRRWLAGERARGIVAIAHGASEHSGRYDRFARYLVAGGFEVVALDHRGHGGTAASTGPGRLGPRGMEGALDDIGLLLARARQERPGVPAVLFGHSMGSIIAQGFVERPGHGLAGYVLSGSPGVPDFPPELFAGIEGALAAGLGDEPASLFAAFNEPFSPARTPYDWLSRDPAEVDRYLADPWCGDAMPLTHAYVAGMFSLLRDAMSPEGIARTPKGLPVLLVTGEMDPVSQMGAQVRVLENRLREAGLAVTARYYPGRHELLNETNRDAVQADILAWVEGVVAR